MYTNRVSFKELFEPLCTHHQSGKTRAGDLSKGQVATFFSLDVQCVSSNNVRIFTAVEKSGKGNQNFCVHSEAAHCTPTPNSNLASDLLKKELEEFVLDFRNGMMKRRSGIFREVQHSQV
ncbi:unnamed protein product [Orchesella dallaii]|uniref:Uncharacterized protein n=1 Tax=Orchesella dallaii TaxID=48710 RepID=A0ABP1S2T5_9HEXA